MRWLPLALQCHSVISRSVAAVSRGCEFPNVFSFALELEIAANMSDLSYAFGEVCDMGCNYTFPERIAEFARTHPENEAFVFRQMEGKR